MHKAKNGREAPPGSTRRLTAAEFPRETGLQACRASHQREFRIKYAGTDEIRVMIDVLLGGGVMDVVRIAQNLFDDGHGQAHPHQAAARIPATRETSQTIEIVPIA